MSRVPKNVRNPLRVGMSLDTRVSVFVCENRLAYLGRLSRRQPDAILTAILRDMYTDHTKRSN